jgi:LytS/YehU family sensor histidine kinase
VQGDKLAANRYLSRFSKLIRSALQHSRVTKIPLEDDLDSLKNYLELEQLRFNGGFDFQVKVAAEIDLTEVTIPSMLIQPFVENAIVHGLTNLAGKGKIEIDLQRNNEVLFITITDNGIGIEASKKQKVGIASSHKSVGMTITKRRLEMLSANQGTGDILVQELKDENGKVLGTQVTLQIPLEE